MKRIYTLLLFVFLVSAASAQLVINEVDYDQPGTDSSEFVELYNSSANAIDLSDYTLILFNGNATSWPIYDSIVFSSHLLAPGGFYVICGSSTGLVSPCDTFLATSVGTGAIQNGSVTSPFCDAIALRLNSTQAIVDAVSYEGNCAPYVEGNGIPDTLADNGTTAGVSISRYPDGHDTQDNSADFHLVCSTPGATNCSPVGITPVASAAKLSVYPNPANSVLSVDAPASRHISVTIRNILGREVKRASVTHNKLQVDVSNLDDGVYLLFINSDSGESTQRLVIRH